MAEINYAIVTDPALPRNIASSLEAQRSSLDEICTDLESVRSAADEASDGLTSEAIVNDLSRSLTTTQKLSEDLDSLIFALSTLARTLEDLDSQMVTEAVKARSGGLTTSSDRIYAPNNSDDPDFQAKVALFNKIADRIYWLRIDEANAHEEFESTCDDLRGIEGLLNDELGFHGDIRDLSTGVSWLERLAIGGLWAVKQATSATFKPRWPAGALVNGLKVGGRFRAISEMGSLEKLVAKTRPENWVPKAGHASDTTRSLNKGLTKATKFFDVAGKALGVLDGAISAYEQWQEDSANPSMGTTEKIARATTHGVLEGAGGYYGAAAGAKIGAAIGSFGGPVGIAVGGIAGGVIGGIAGSKLGEKIADGIGSFFSRFSH